MSNEDIFIEMDDKKPWTYGIYSSVLIRFNQDEVQILRNDTQTWSDVKELHLYRRLVEECDIIPTP